MAIKKKQQEVSVIRRATQALREEVLGRPDGAFLGSESTLMSLLGVSRPTFRQAAKLVEQEQLLTIRRGVGGGFFARQPSTRGVAHVAAVYLLSRKATMEDAIRAARPLFAQTARLGARRRDPVLNARLAAFWCNTKRMTRAARFARFPAFGEGIFGDIRFTERKPRIAALCRRADRFCGNIRRHQCLCASPKPHDCLPRNSPLADTDHHQR